MIEYILLIVGTGLSVFFGFYFYKIFKVILKNQELHERVLCEQRQKMKENNPYLICYKCIEDPDEEGVEECRAITG